VDPNSNLQGLSWGWLVCRTQGHTMLALVHSSQALSPLYPHEGFVTVASSRAYFVRLVCRHKGILCLRLCAQLTCTLTSFRLEGLRWCAQLTSTLISFPYKGLHWCAQPSGALAPFPDLRWYAQLTGTLISVLCKQ